eukprot:8071567-Pyramimonas_sp.AAC.1
MQFDLASFMVAAQQAGLTPQQTMEMGMAGARALGVNMLGAPPHRDSSISVSMPPVITYGGNAMRGAGAPPGPPHGAASAAPPEAAPLADGEKGVPSGGEAAAGQATPFEAALNEFSGGGPLASSKMQTASAEDVKAVDAEQTKLLATAKAKADAQNN